MELSISKKDGRASVFQKAVHVRAGKSERNYLKTVTCMGFICDDETPEEAETELLTFVRPLNRALSENMIKNLGAKQ